MGYCFFCTHKWFDDDGRMYCSIINQYVSRKGSCSHFKEEKNASNSGYTGGTGCFLTSACVDFYGKEDDCEELTILRAFRDTYMQATEAGRKLVQEYYEIAPLIVEHIEGSGKSAVYYEYIYSVVQACLVLLQKKKYAETQELYKNMVKKLKKEFEL